AACPIHPHCAWSGGGGRRPGCAFALCPEPGGGPRSRPGCVGPVGGEPRGPRRYFPQVREYFFDDDTLTDDLPRVEALARCLGGLGVTWSCNAKANVPYSILRILKDNGLRLLLVGYESGDPSILNNVKKGVRLDVDRRFTREA